MLSASHRRESVTLNLSLASFDWTFEAAEIALRTDAFSFHHRAPKAVFRNTINYMSSHFPFYFSDFSLFQFLKFLIQPTHMKTKKNQQRKRLLKVSVLLFHSGMSPEWASSQHFALRIAALKFPFWLVLQCFTKVDRVSKELRVRELHKWILFLLNVHVGTQDILMINTHEQ